MWPAALPSRGPGHVAPWRVLAQALASFCQSPRHDPLWRLTRAAGTRRTMPLEVAAGPARRWGRGIAEGCAWGGRGSSQISKVVTGGPKSGWWPKPGGRKTVDGPLGATAAVGGGMNCCPEAPLPLPLGAHAATLRTREDTHLVSSTVPRPANISCGPVVSRFSHAGYRLKSSMLELSGTTDT